MTVREADPAWAAYNPDRELVSDMFKGRKTALERIRPLPGHEANTQALFASGAYFLPVVARTVEAFGGLVFGKQPTRVVPETLTPMLEDVTGSGQDVDRLAEQGFDGVLLSGNIALLTDCPPGSPNATRAAAEAAGIRPTLQLYTGGDVISARYRSFGAIRKLAHVRLVERVQEPDANDEFKLVEVVQVRVLDLKDGFYRQRVFREDNGWKLYGLEIWPLMGNKRLDHIPIDFANPRDGEAKPAKPVVADLAEISVAHLNNSAALEWALLWTANPTPVFTGVPKGASEIKLGSSQGIVLDLEGTATFLEFTGQGLQSLESALENKRRDAAMMGARMLVENKAAPETAETAKINRAGEVSVVGGIANALSDCFTKALKRLAEWGGITGEISYKLNADFNPAGLSPQMLTALLAAVQAGKLSEQEFFAILQGYEIVDPAKTFEDHVSELPEEPTPEDILAAGGIDPLTGKPKAPAGKTPPAPAPADA